MARALIERTEWNEADRRLQNLEIQLRNRGSDSVSVEGLLEALHLRLKNAIHSNRPTQADAIVQRIVRVNESLEEEDETPTIRALLAASLGVYEVYTGSAENAIQRLAPLSSLGQLSPHITLAAALLLGIANYRAGRWDRAIKTYERAYRLARERNDLFYQHSCLTNMMSLALDIGNWETVESLYDQLHDLRYGLPEVCHAVANPRHNMADACLYQGRFREAVQRFDNLLKWITANLESSALLPAVKSGLGLSYLALGDIQSATSIAKKTNRWEWQDLMSVPTREEAVWFRAYLNWDNDPQGMSRLMNMVGHQEVHSDLSAGLRILWLRSLFNTSYTNGWRVPRNRDIDSDLAQRLREARLGWFIAFSQRWLRAARRNDL
jgi:tetratricopeptide (TPR) repeat protein